MKIRTLLSASAFFFALLFTMTSCLKDEVEVERFFYTSEEYAIIESVLSLPRDLESYKVTLPQHMKNFGLQEPIVSDAKATLGRVLFYDKKLSRNNSVNCESCHHQELAFSDDVAHSEGFDGELTPRNSLPLAAAVNFKSSYDGGGGSFGFAAAGFFWDERAGSVEEQSTLTIQDNIEMGMDLDELEIKLNQEDHYRLLFRKAYGDEVITKDRILNALSQFVNAFVSKDSKFDEGMAQTFSPFGHFPNFSDSENRGKSLFNENCTSCHSADHSTLSETIANNGLDVVYEDPGVGGITGHAFDLGKFKVPFLRNIALTYPYMHDGRFETLEEVVDHYSTGIQMHENLDHRLRDTENIGNPRKFNFSDQDKEDLVNYLNTLTDTYFVEDAKFSDPFK